MLSAAKVNPRKLLAGVQIFAGLSERALDEVVALTSSRVYEARETVFREGDPGGAAFAIFHGLLKATAAGSDGTQITLSLMGPGETFGELAMLDGHPRSATVTVMEPALLLVLEPARFHVLLRKNPDISYRALRATAARLRQLTGRMEDVAFLDVPTRLAKKLLELAAARGTAVGRGWVRLEPRLSQRDLGALIGATRESVNKNLKALAGHGAVERRGSALLVDVARLRDLLLRLP